VKKGEVRERRWQMWKGGLKIKSGTGIWYKNDGANFQSWGVSVLEGKKKFCHIFFLGINLVETLLTLVSFGKIITIAFVMFIVFLWKYFAYNIGKKIVSYEQIWSFQWDRTVTHFFTILNIECKNTWNRPRDSCRRWCHSYNSCCAPTASPARPRGNKRLRV
jgi:hypothetical protein